MNKYFLAAMTIAMLHVPLFAQEIKLDCENGVCEVAQEDVNKVNLEINSNNGVKEFDPTKVVIDTEGKQIIHPPRQEDYAYQLEIAQLMYTFKEKQLEYDYKFKELELTYKEKVQVEKHNFQKSPPLMWKIFGKKQCSARCPYSAN